MFRSEATGEEDQATAEDQHEEEAEKTQTVTETINETNLLHIELDIDITYIMYTLKICILRNLLLLVLYLPHIYHFLLHVNPQNKHLLLKPH